MTTVRCVVFDVDDTLYLERDYVRSGFEAVERWAGAELAATGLGARAWELFEAGRRGDTFDAAAAAVGIDARWVPAMVEVYRAHEPDILLLPDACAALDAARRVGACIAVVTDGPLASQRGKVRALGLERWSSLTVLTGELGPGLGKPHPAAFELVEARLGHRGPQCVYLADNPAKDFGGPAALGWRTVRVRRAGSLHHEVPSGPDAEAEWPDLGPMAELLG